MAKTAKTQTADPVCRVYVPIDPLNPHENELTLSINGQCLTVPLGRLISLPENFCKLLVNSGRITGYETDSHD